MSASDSKTAAAIPRELTIAMEDSGASSNCIVTMLASPPPALAAAAAARHRNGSGSASGSQSSSGSEASSRSTSSAAPFVFNEAKRLAAVLRYVIKDTPKEATFDNITEAAAEICQVPASLITVVDSAHTWFKSNLGFGDAVNSKRELSLCDHVIRSNELLVIPDLTKDARFANNPFVVSPPSMRFYAGAPLIDSETGQALGALCVIDFVPRQLNEMQKQALKLLARQVMAACESRLRIIHLEDALLQLEETRGALKASKEQAERAQKQAEQANMTKSEFLANMSHEIRTPLNGVLGTASLLAETTRLDFEQKDYVRVIQSSGEHLLIVLNDILDFSKFESGKLEIDAGRVDLQSMLEQAIELSFKPKPTLELVYEIGEDVPEIILGDITRLRQIVANLISNASKFTTKGEVSLKVQRMTAEEILAHQGPPLMEPASPPAAPETAGSQTIPDTAAAPAEMSDVAGDAMDADEARARQHQQQQPVHHHYNSLHHSPAGVAASMQQQGASHDGPTTVTANVTSIRSPLGHLHTAPLNSHADSLMLVFSVSDTGIGIDASKIHKLFSAFTQLDISITREYGGTGLGLAISARLAQLMGGTMWVKSEVGKGSTFFFSIRTRPQTGPPIGFGGNGGNSTGSNASTSSSSNGGIGGASNNNSNAGASMAISSPPSHSHSTSSDDLTALTPHPLAAAFPAWNEIPSHTKVAGHYLGRTHVMVVESNSHLLLSLVVQLRKWGLTPLSYADVNQAKAALQEPCVIEHKLAAIIFSQTFSSPSSATRTLANANAPPTASDEQVYVLVDAIRALDQIRADGSYVFTTPQPTTFPVTRNNLGESLSGVMEDDVVEQQNNTGLSIETTSAAVAPASTDAPVVICPEEYIIPCIILLPTELEDDPSTAATIAAARTAFVRARRCNPLHKPVLFSKLARKLDKVFRFALYGEDPYPNTSAPEMTLAPTPLAPVIPHSTPMRSRVLAQHIPTHSASASAAGALASASASSTASPLPHASARLFSSLHPLRILVVEDNSVNMKLALKMLQTLGYTDVAQAWNGQEAVDRMVRQGDERDLILMDSVMPLLTGPQACRQIMDHYRTQLPHKSAPVVIALTASCMESDKEEAKASGHADFISKPIALSTLKSKLQQWAKTIHANAKAAAKSTTVGAGLAAMES